MYVICILIAIALVLLVLNIIYIPPNTKEGFISFGYPWNRYSGWNSGWWNRPWFNRPYYPSHCPAGCVYSGYGSNRQSGFKCIDPGANCPVGASWCCQYDYDCNAC